MAKRKRLTPQPTPRADPAPQRAPETKALNGWVGVRPRPAPIADVAGSSAAQAALEEVAGEMADARREGRLILRLPLDAIDETHLVRDRAFVDPDEMTALEQSLRARGQQTPIEVLSLGEGRYGLISGWRRLIALRRLRAETQSGEFGHALCLVRTPGTATDAYLAMVEENEIRAGLSFYERARIAARAAEQGAFPTPRHAVKGLFGNASAAKRSKIGSFLGVYDALDEVLQFPAALSERQGLALAKALEADAGLARAIAERLRAARPQDAAEEKAVLSGILSPEEEQPAPPAPSPTPSPASSPARAAPPAREPAPEGIRIARGKGRVVLTGTGVTEELMDALEAWLAARE